MMNTGALRQRSPWPRQLRRATGAGGGGQRREYKWGISFLLVLVVWIAVSQRISVRSVSSKRAFMLLSSRLGDSLIIDSVSQDNGFLPISGVGGQAARRASDGSSGGSGLRSGRNCNGGTSKIVFTFSATAHPGSIHNLVHQGDSDLTRRVWISKDSEAYAHMATAAVVKAPPKGHVILAAWQSSSKFEGASDQSILISESHDGGGSWAEPRVAIPPMDGAPVWGPILHSSTAISSAAATSSIAIRNSNDNTSGELLLIYSRSRPICTVPGRLDRFSPGGDVMLSKSNDGGKTFSHPRLILPMEYDVMGAGSGLMSKGPGSTYSAPFVTANKILSMKLSWSHRQLHEYYRRQGRLAQIVGKLQGNNSLPSSQKPSIRSSPFSTARSARRRALLASWDPSGKGSASTSSKSTVTWLLPVWRESRGDCGLRSRDAAYALISLDRGETWALSRGISRSNITWYIEGSIVQAPSTSAENSETSARLLHLFRTKSGFMFFSQSSNNGLEWTEPQPCSIPNPDSKANAIVPALQGSVVFAYNNSTDIGRRTPLVISDFIYNAQGSFTPGGFDTVLERDDNAQFSYPTLFQIASSSAYAKRTKKYRASSTASAIDRLDAKSSVFSSGQEGVSTVPIFSSRGRDDIDTDSSSHKSKKRFFETALRHNRRKLGLVSAVEESLRADDVPSALTPNDLKYSSAKMGAVGIRREVLAAANDSRANATVVLDPIERQELQSPSLSSPLSASPQQDVGVISESEEMQLRATHNIIGVVYTAKNAPDDDQGREGNSSRHSGIKFAKVFLPKKQINRLELLSGRLSLAADAVVWRQQQQDQGEVTGVEDRNMGWPKAALPPSATSALRMALEQGWPMSIDITFTAVTTLAAAIGENITLEPQPVQQQEQQQQQHRCFPMLFVSAKDPRHAVTIAAMGLSLDSTSSTKTLPWDVGVLGLSDHQGGACTKAREGGCAITLGQRTTVRLSIWASEQSESYVKVRVQLDGPASCRHSSTAKIPTPLLQGLGITIGGNEDGGGGREEGRRHQHWRHPSPNPQAIDLTEALGEVFAIHLHSLEMSVSKPNCVD